MANKTTSITTGSSGSTISARRHLNRLYPNPNVTWNGSSGKVSIINLLEALIAVIGEILSIIDKQESTGSTCSHCGSLNKNGSCHDIGHDKQGLKCSQNEYLRPYWLYPHPNQLVSDSDDSDSDDSDSDDSDSDDDTTVVLWTRMVFVLLVMINKDQSVLVLWTRTRMSIMFSKMMSKNSIGEYW